MELWKFSLGKTLVEVSWVQNGFALQLYFFDFREQYGLALFRHQQLIIH
jgi:hypothetical protein